MKDYEVMPGFSPVTWGDARQWVHDLLERKYGRAIPVTDEMVQAV